MCNHIIRHHGLKGLTPPDDNISDKISDSPILREPDCVCAQCRILITGSLKVFHNADDLLLEHKRILEPREDA